MQNNDKNLNNSIKCNVYNCKYQNCDCCTLDKIQVSCTCNNDECSCKKETICDSFKEK